MLNTFSSTIIMNILFKKIESNPITAGILLTLLPVIILITWWLNSTVDLTNWASFATYTSLGLSVTTVVFVLMTYLTQTKTSTILQFESTYFQWLSIFHDSICRDNETIASFAKNTAISYIRKIDANFNGNFIPTKSYEERICTKHYKTLYQILRYIHTSEIISDQNKKKYFDIIQSQLTDEQLMTFFILLLMDKERYNTKVFSPNSYHEILDKNHFFKNLYISNQEKNFNSISDFLRKTFPHTASSFYWL